MSAYSNNPEPVLDMKKLTRVSGWANNCALGCFSYFFTEKLLNNDAELNDRFENPKNIYYQEYQKILKSFEEYYGVPITLTKLKKFLEQYQNPLDYEAILSPVLRLSLSKNLWDAKTCWNTIPKIKDWVREFFRTNIVTNVSNSSIGPSREGFFDLLKKHQYGNNIKEHEEAAAIYRRLPVRNRELAYERYLKYPPEFKVQYPTLTNNINSLEDFIRFLNEYEAKEAAFMKEAEAFWIQSGYEQYKKQVGDAIKTEMISDEELNHFGETLGISIFIYELIKGKPVKRDEIQEKKDLPTQAGFKHFQLLILNRVNHWEFMMNDEKVAEKHNDFHLRSEKNLEDSGVFGIMKPHRTVLDIKNDVKQKLTEFLNRKAPPPPTISQVKKRPPPPPPLKPDISRDEWLAKELARQFEEEEKERVEAQEAKRIADEAETKERAAVALAKKTQSDADEQLAKDLAREQENAAAHKPSGKKT